MTPNSQRPFIDLTYYDTYYLANIVKNVLEDPFTYLQSLDDFYGDDRYLSCVRPFQKFSAFHAFVAFIVAAVIDEDMGDVDLADRQQDAADLIELELEDEGALGDPPTRLPLNVALEKFGIAHLSLEEWLKARLLAFADATDNDIAEYHELLREDGAIEELTEAFTREVFFVLFQNRNTLMLFNAMMARQVERGADEDVDPDCAQLFLRPGVLRRATIPKWVKRAVFFRDRGLCVLCQKDLTGLVNIWARDNYDHIVPLGVGGMNDVTNIQLLCQACNAEKRAGSSSTSSRYESWYS